MHSLLLGRGALIPEQLRYRGLYVVGKSGAGKSTMLQRAVLQDARHPHASIVFDSGDLCRDIYEALPEKQLARTTFFTVERPLSYNPLVHHRSEPARLENEIFALLDQLNSEASNVGPLTPRMKRLASIALRHILRQPEPTLADLARCLLERRTDLQEAMQLRTEDYLMTWDGLIDRLAFLRDERIRNILCLPSELNFATIIDEGRLLLVSLQGLEPALKRFVGTLMFNGLQSVILERSKEQRRDVSIWVDEFTDFVATPAAAANFQVLFSSGRKYRVALCVAHTDHGMIQERLLRTILGTVSSLVAFSCGSDEADRMHAAMESFMSGPGEPHHIGHQPDYTAWTRINDRVVQFHTREPVQPLRRRGPVEPTHEAMTPPDPLEVHLPDEYPDPTPIAHKLRF